MQSATVAAASTDRAGGEGLLPELAAVWWRPRASQTTLRRSERLWTATTVAHTLPFAVVAVVLAALKPLLVPVSLLALAQAWIIPELYAARGAKVLRPPRRGNGLSDRSAAEHTALGLLGDLLDHGARALHGHTGLVLERGDLGTWLLGEAGAVLVRPSGRRVHCYCVKTNDHDLPAGDRIAHLLLALRTDEAGFATVANSAFCGARWRLRRRLDARTRVALDAVKSAKKLRYPLGRASN